MAVETGQKLTNLEQLALLGSAVKSITDGIEAKINNSMRSLVVNDNTVTFYSGANGTGTSLGSFNFPKELFLDQTKTTFVPSFTWSTSTYPNSTNPNLNGKPVIVLAVRGTVKADRTGAEADTISYSFIDVSTLVDTYTVNTDNGDTVSSKVLVINGYKVSFKLNTDSNNALQATATGLKVDITGKADKVSGATANNLAALNSSGNLTDSGIPKANVLLNEYLASNAEVTTAINNALGIS